MMRHLYCSCWNLNFIEVSQEVISHDDWYMHDFQNAHYVNSLCYIRIILVNLTMWSFLTPRSFPVDVTYILSWVVLLFSGGQLLILHKNDFHCYGMYSFQFECYCNKCNFNFYSFWSRNAINNKKTKISICFWKLAKILYAWTLSIVIKHWKVLKIVALEIFYL